MSRVALSDHSTSVCVSGPSVGNPVVFLHAALLDQHMWQPVWRQLAMRGNSSLELISYDLRDHGQATSSPSLNSIAQLAADLHDLIKALERGPVHLVGASLGGVVSQHLAACHPDLVQSLCLVATAAEFPFDAFMSRADAMRKQGPVSSIEESMIRWFNPVPGTTQGAGRSYALGRLRSVSADQWERTWRAFAGYRVPLSVEPFVKRVLAVAGGRDTSTPKPVMEELRHWYPQFELVTIETAAHLIPLDSSDILSRLVAQHLNVVMR